MSLLAYLPVVFGFGAVVAAPIWLLSTLMTASLWTLDASTFLTALVLMAVLAFVGLAVASLGGVLVAARNHRRRSGGVRR